MAGISVALGDRESPLSAFESPLPLDRMIAGSEPWEVEIGFGKGRYLLRRAAESPRRRFIGIEVAGQYFRLVRRRLLRRGLDNVVLVHGEALYLLSAVLPGSFAEAVHVYFPDPWPKARHQGRRLFDAETVDLVLRLLRPNGVLFFASDHLEYAQAVAEILDSHPGVERTRVDAPWNGEPRTNYEAKYLRQGRPIARYEVRLRQPMNDRGPHPAADRALRSAVRPCSGEDGEA